MPPRLARPAARTELVFPVAGDVLREESVPRKLIGQALEGGADALHLDLQAVQAPTAAGLGALVTVYLELRAAGVDLVLLNVRPEMHRVFQVTGLARLFDYRPLTLPETHGARH